MRLRLHSKWMVWAAAVVLLLAGLGLRLVDLHDAPLDFHPTRQLHSALIARGMYAQTAPQYSDWQRQRAAQQQAGQELIEPQIMERLSAWGYSLLGREDLAVPRLLAIFFWTLGGLGLFWLGLDSFGAGGALAALTLYLFLPYGVYASRAFQPDPLMTAAMLWALWALLRWQRKPGWARALAAGALTGLAIYIKLTVIFFLAGAWIAVLLASIGLRAALRSRQVWAIGALSLLPYLAYHLYGTLGLGLLQGQFSLRFFPAMWLDWTFYLRWALKVNSVVPWPWLALAVAGLLTLPRKPERAVWLGVGAGYLVYALIFAYYTTTHDYYQLPLVPLAAIGVGAAFAALGRSFQGSPRLAWLLTAAMLAGFALLQAYTVRQDLLSVNFSRQAALAEQVSTLFAPQESVVSLAPDYSMDLEYWGWLNVTNWFTTGDFALRAAAGDALDWQQYLDDQTAGKDYFLIMDFDEYARQPQVQAWLEQNYSMFAQGDGYQVYALHGRQ